MDRFAAWPQEDYEFACDIFPVFKLLMSWELDWDNNDPEEFPNALWCHLLEGTSEYTADELTEIRFNDPMADFVHEEFCRITTLSPPVSDEYKEEIQARFVARLPATKTCRDVFGAVSDTIGIPGDIKAIIQSYI